MGLFVFSIIQNNLPEKKSSHTKNGSSEFRVSNNRDMGFVSSYFSILDSYLCWILQLDPVINKRGHYETVELQTSLSSLSVVLAI